MPLRQGGARSLPRPLAVLPRSTDWLNTGPLTAGDLGGKVVLVNFWTYSCINSLRPLPYLRAWADKYRDRGLVVVGVHTPEFEFERKISNVRQAVRDLGVDFPVTLDSDYLTWRAFGNNSWPGFYLFGADGRVRHQAFGEGGYDRMERVLQRLLAEVDAGEDTSLVSVSGQGTQAAPDWPRLRSPETYVGYDQARNFSSPGGLARDRARTYLAPSGLGLNYWALAGDWIVGGEAASPNSGNGGIVHRFQARDLHMVLGGTPSGRPSRFRVTLDGQPPGASHGTDVDEQGWGAVGDDKLYQLVRQTGTIGARRFEIRFAEPGVKAYSFTFG